MIVLHKVILRFNGIPNQISMIFFSTEEEKIV